MHRIITAAIREFRSTALTKAFFFGAVVFPLLIWGIAIGVGAMKFEKPPLKGEVVIDDRSQNATVAAALERHFDPQEQERQARMLADLIDRLAKEQAQRYGISEQQFRKQAEMAMSVAGIGVQAEVAVRRLESGEDEAALRDRVRAGSPLALVRIDELTMALDPARLMAAAAAQSDADQPGPGTYEFVQGTSLRPDHARMIRDAVERAVRDERYRRAGVEPMTVRALAQLPVTARSVIVTATGEKKSNEVLTRLLPFIFMMLIYIGAITGGQYLMMGTLEEKSSRVMEVVLSAMSARELLIGKLVGQGLVGLAVLAIYTSVGYAVAGRFGVTAQIPMDILPWVLVYFVMAYTLIGAMMLAIGSAVTEIREAQALTTPVTILVIMPFLLIMPIMQNPGSALARAFSFFPPTTPYVMVMRLSQPSHVIPLWELIATLIVGFAGVVATVWAAAKIFRVGVLMYGKPPTLVQLFKWVRQA